LDASDGKLKWHFQFTPNDPYDYDEVGEAQIIDMTVNGVTTKGVVRAARNGFIYGFDRLNGQFLYGKQYVDTLNWTTGLDPKTGRPLNYDPQGGLQKYAAGTVGQRDTTPMVYCPTLGGGKNWQPASLSARTGLLYINSNEGCSSYMPTVAPNPTITGGTYNVLTAQREWNGRLPAPQGIQMPRVFNGGSAIAIDPKTGANVAETLVPFRGNGMLATAGGLVFTADRGGDIIAYDDMTLQPVWRRNFGTSFGSPPMSYSVGGTQYIAVLAGFNPAPIHIQNNPAAKHFVSLDAVFVLSVN
jgi:alcohol dehydrogenase (cytochrome c)